MRIGSSTLNQNKPLSKSNIIKGIIPTNFKKYNINILDGFNNLNAWSPLRGTWSTDGNKLSTSTSPSLYPIITSFDSRSTNITATMSLDSAGPGVGFWIQDQDNWWAASTYYTLESENYITGYADIPSTCRDTCHWAIYCPPGKGSSCNGPCCSANCSAGQPLGGGRVCDQGPVYQSRSRYNFYINLLRSVNGTVSQEAIVLVRSTANIQTEYSPATISSEDDISAIQISTLDNTINITALNNSGSAYGTTISYTASNPNKGYKNGIIYTPGSSYQLSSNVDSLELIG
jgi:hypothetical protein